MRKLTGNIQFSMFKVGRQDLNVQRLNDLGWGTSVICCFFHYIAAGQERAFAKGVEAVVEDAEVGNAEVYYLMAE